MHTVAADTDPRLLPDIVAALVDRNERRRTQRARAWRRESAQTRARQAAYQRFATARQQAAARERGRTKNYGYERELSTSSGYCRSAAIVFHKLSLAKQRRLRGASEFADGSARDVKSDHLVVG